MSIKVAVMMRHSQKHLVEYRGMVRLTISKSLLLNISELQFSFFMCEFIL